MAYVVGAVLTLGVGSCCLGVEEEPWSVDVDEEISGDEYLDARDAHVDNDDRCKEACATLAETKRYISMGDVTSCEATVVDPQEGDPDNAWLEPHVRAHIVCHAEGVEIPFCTGRRPLGHREASLVLGSRGAWFALQAHLERASIAAFEELGAWLALQGAPQQLVERCRAAQHDEVEHARVMSEHAERAGAEVPPVESEARSEGLLEVAIHNAVEGCVSEAFAAVIAAHQARAAETPALRSLFETLAADELRHGQLAWDIHAWLLTRLSARERATVLAAQAEALARLPGLTRSGAELTPPGLGWPEPELAAAMAQRFASLIQDAPLAA